MIRTFCKLSPKINNLILPKFAESHLAKDIIKINNDFYMNWYHYHNLNWGLKMLQTHDPKLLNEIYTIPLLHIWMKLTGSEI